MVRKGFSRLFLVMIFLSMHVTESTSQQKVVNGANDRVASKGRVLINSNPTGAIVYLEGLYKFTGRTPFVVPYPLRGVYKIKTTKEGYESFTSNTNFVGKGEDNLLIKLSPKTRGKAAIRSLLFPGWGQVYGEHNVRGIIISTVQLGLGIGTLLAINSYNNAQDDFENALRDFELNMSQDAFRTLQAKENSAGEAYNRRNTMLLVTAIFWVYNVFDSIVFFSQKGAHIDFKSTPVSNIINDKNVMLSLKLDL